MQALFTWRGSGTRATSHGSARGFGLPQSTAYRPYLPQKIPKGGPMLVAGDICWCNRALARRWGEAHGEMRSWRALRNLIVDGVAVAVNSDTRPPAGSPARIVIRDEGSPP